MALAAAFRLHAAGRTQVNPKQMLAIGPGHFFQTMAAAAPDLGYAANKWVGVVAANAARSEPTVNALVMLSEIATGVPVALIDGTALTILRTAAMSGLAAQHLARPDSRSIGFVGCGAQAHGHLMAFLALLPGLETAVCVSRGGASAERLAQAARFRGLSARVPSDPTSVLACDIVVTSVQQAPGVAPILDPAQLQPGSFVAAVDLGAPWLIERVRALDIVATDDRVQANEPSTRARLRYDGAFDADLGELVAGLSPGRTDADQRAMFLFPGFALADLAVAVALFEAARRLGCGTALPS